MVPDLRGVFAVCVSVAGAAAAYRLSPPGSRATSGWASVWALMVLHFSLRLLAESTGWAPLLGLAGVALFAAGWAIAMLPAFNDGSRIWLRPQFAFAVGGGTWILTDMLRVVTFPWASLLTAAMFLWAALRAWYRPDARARSGSRLVFAGCLTVAVSLIAGAFVQGTYLIREGLVLALLILVFGMLLQAYERAHAEAEDRVLTLSTLAHAIGSCPDTGAVQKLFGDWLDGVLGFARLQKAVLCVFRFGSAPATTVCKGLSPEFTQQWEQEHLARTCAELLEKWGGFLAVPDTRRSGPAGRLEDAPGYDSFRRLLEFGGGQGFLAVSLRARSSVRGFLILLHPAGWSLPPGALRVLAMLSSQLAIGIENYVLVSDSERRTSELRLLNGQFAFLHEIARIAISTLSSEEMLEEIVTEIHRNLKYDHISIGVCDSETGRMRMGGVAGLTSAPSRSFVAFTEGVIGRVARNREMVLLDRIAPEERLQTVLPDARSIACLPILHGGQLLGVLNVESRRESALTQNEVPVLRTLADHLASALHNAFVFEQTQEQAVTDGLTGIKTRRFLAEALEAECQRAFRSGRPFSLLLVDLDNFKRVNDTLGHVEGDQVLVRVGQILQQRCRRSNVVARYGGDEFVILMPEAVREQAQVLATRLCTWFAEDDLLSRHHVTASFGVATSPADGASSEQLMRAADAGLYLAKRLGGNRVELAPRPSLNAQA